MSTPVRSSPLGLTVLGMLQTQPLHPYGIQRLIKQWGKDQVVNVGQRASLYRTIDRLHAGGLVAVRETERDQQYPERTVYQITPAGQAAARQWLEEMLSVARQEFPEFPAALSHILMLTPEESLQLLQRRERQLAQAQQGLDAGLAAGAGLPRVLMLETEYVHAVGAAQLAWIRRTIEDLSTGRLTWSHQQLAAMALQQPDTESDHPL